MMMVIFNIQSLHEQNFVSIFIYAVVAAWIATKAEKFNKNIFKILNNEDNMTIH